MYRWQKSMDVQQPAQTCEDQTEAILFSTPSLSSCHRLPSSIMVGSFQTKSGTYDSILNSNLTVKQHIIGICQTASCELKCISSIRRCLSKTTGNFFCIVQIRPLQFSSHGHSQLCYSTNAESPKYCCRPYSQSTMPSKLHTSPTATPLAPNFWMNKIQNCLHVLQCNHRFCPVLSFWATTP